MFPVSHPEAAMRDAILLFTLSIEKTVLRNIFFINRSEEIYTKTVPHIRSLSLLISISQTVRNILKYFIYQIKITDVFSTFRSKYHFEACFSAIFVSLFHFDF